MMNFNVKSGKNFRDALALWHIATFKISDEICQKNANVKALVTLIKSNNDMLTKLANGEKSVTKSEEELLSEIEEFNRRIELESERISKLREEFESDIKRGTDLITDGLIESINTYMSDIYSNENNEIISNAFIEWFKSNGFADADSNSVAPFIKAIGLRKNSAKNMCKTNKHLGVQSKKATIDLILGAVCDEPNLNKLLPIYKWTTIIEKKNK